MMRTSCLDIRISLRLMLVLALPLVGAISVAAQPPAPAKPGLPQIDKMDGEVTRGALVAFTGRNFPDKAEDITVILDEDTKTPIQGNPVRIDVNAEKAGTFYFVIPSDEKFPLGRHNVRVEFKQTGGISIPRRADIPFGGVLTVYGGSGKTEPKIAAVYPVLGYPKDDLFSIEILGEGFSKIGSDNVVFREGRGDIPVCWDDACKAKNPGWAHGKVVGDRLISLERIPREFFGNSKIGVRVGVLQTASTAAMTLSRVREELPRVVSLVGFLVLFGLVLWIVGRGVRGNAIAGRSHGLVTALLLDKETDTLSLSRLQFFLWTGAAVFGYLYLAVARSLVQGKLEFVDVPEGLPGIILISAATTVVAQGITAAKGPKGAGEVHPSAADLITVGGVVAPERFQFLIWTVLGVLAFVFLVVLQDPGTIQELPKVPTGFMQLMGVSSAGYLGGKLARKSGPVIDEIVANQGSLELKILGRGLSRDAGFRIGEEDLTSDKITSSDTATPGKPKIIDKDTQTGDENMAKVLELIIKDPKPEWLPSGRLTIINPDGQKASWSYSITTQDATDADNSIDGCDVPIENPTSDEDLPAAEGGVG
jgi:hypothetical protein